MFHILKSTPKYKKQVQQYVTWRRSQPQYSLVASTEELWVHDFFKKSGITDLSDATCEHVKKYMQIVKNEYGSTHSYRTAVKAIGCFFAHFHSKNIPCISRQSIYRTIRA